jgi:hypothetical protein
MVEQLNAELAAKGIRKAEARVGDAEDLDLPDCWFDVVTGGFMIFFPPDPPRGPPGAAPRAGAGRHSRLVDLRRAVRLPMDG